MASLTEFTEQLGAANAAHLLRRATFGPTKDQIDQYAALTPSAAIDLLFPASADDVVDPTPPIDTATGSTWVNPPTAPRAIEGTNSEQDTLMGFYKAWHTDVMLQSGNIVERIVWFFHTHIPARWTEIQSSEAIYYQNCTFRYYAMRSFKDLFKKICIDNAMLRYLDGYTNHANNPNENFAREMFELYSIGKGPQVGDGNYTNYTEHDIKEATKVLTGWLFDETFSAIDAEHGWPTGVMQQSTGRATAHDSTTKTFSSIYDEQSITPGEMDGGYATVEAAEQELSDMIDMIFDHEETAKFIVRKIYRQFVYHFISDEVEADIIEPLATTFRTNNYEVQAVLKQLLVSEHFYDADDDPAETNDDNIGAIIKSPLELSLGILRFFDVETPDRDASAAQFYTDFESTILPRFPEQGLNYYEPFEVAGYPAYHQMPGFGRNWVMPTELARRYQVGEVYMKRIGDGSAFSFHLDVLDWVENSGHISNPGNADELVTFFTDHFLAVAVDTERYEFFRDVILLDELPASTWQSEWLTYTGGGNDAVVRERIEYFVSKLIQTPEFQLN